jgi:small-conductance mechanosensitive channel
MGNTAGDLVVSLCVILLTFACLQALRWLILRQLVRISGRTRTYMDDVASHVVGRTKVFFILLVSIYTGIQSLVLPPNIDRALHIAAVLVVTIQIALWGNVIIAGLLRAQLERHVERDPAAATTLTAAGYILRTVFYALLLIAALDNLGFEVRTLITTLGVGGIAVALALQKVLGDLFGSLSIVLDKPFVIGDFIAVADMAGSVEHIGLKTTRLRSISGEQLVFSNSDLLEARIRNYQRMMERRVVFTLGVTYQTPRESLARIPGIIRATIESRDNVRFDRSHLKSYGPYSIDFETVYYIKTPDYAEFMDAQQQTLLEIHRAFEEAGIEYAYPTQTVFMQPAGAE